MELKILFFEGRQARSPAVYVCFPAEYLVMIRERAKRRRVRIDRVYSAKQPKRPSNEAAELL